MSSRMRYGPRFKSVLAGNAPKYFEETADERRDAQRVFSALRNQPLHKKELRQWRGVQAAAKKFHERTDGARQEREQAEAQMAEAIRKAVEILEFNMTALMQHGVPCANYEKHVNQEMTINAIVQLKKHCGVKFENDDFMQKVPVAPPSPDLRLRTPEQVKIDDDFRALTTQIQRKERLKQEEKMRRLELMRAAAEKLRRK